MTPTLTFVFFASMDDFLGSEFDALTPGFPAAFLPAERGGGTAAVPEGDFRMEELLVVPVEVLRTLPLWPMQGERDGGRRIVGVSVSVGVRREGQSESESDC